MDNVKKCPMCAEEIPVAVSVCPYCGTQFEVKIEGYCANCHDMTAAGEDGKCLKCGTEVLDRRVESRMIESAADFRPAPAAPVAPAGVPVPVPVQSQITGTPRYAGPEGVPLPQPRKKLKWWHIVLMVVVPLSLILCAVILFVVFALPNLPTWFGGTPTLITLADIDQYPVGESVKISGVLNVPGNRVCPGDECALLLTDYHALGKALPIFITVDQQATLRPNRMKPLPDPFTFADIILMTDDGQTIGPSALITIIGRICEAADGMRCLDKITKIYSP